MAGHPHHRAWALLAAAVVTGAVSIAGCGSDDDTPTSTTATTVDDAEVEQGLKEDLSTSSAKVTKASCPSDVKVDQGSTFTCTVTFSSGATGKATVTQRAANTYSYELKPGSVQVPGSVVEASLKEDLAAEGATNATVNCPDNIIVKVDSPVTCEVTGAQGVASGEVTFVFSDAEGTIDSSSVETS